VTTNPFGEVPVLPVVIPFGLALFALLVWRLHARRLLTVPRAAVAAALSIYAAGIIANTIFPIFLDMPDSAEPWTSSLVLIPFRGYEVVDAVPNMAVFVPLGMLIPLLLTRPSWWKALAVVAAASLSIELSQVAVQSLSAGGHIADVNDLIFNVAGGAIGYGLFLLLTLIPGLSRFIDRFRWAQPDPAPPTRAVTNQVG
jgi:glycopeptide antibiotics resistance protein